MKRRHGNHAHLALGFLLLAALPAQAQDWRCVVNLEGSWCFEIGDDPSFAAVDFDDSKWEAIRAPAAWEREGFPGYDGYAWYRKRFRVPAGARDKQLYLRLGRIDDVDETYLNGHLIGYQGQFPPRYDSAYGAQRRYLLPQAFLDATGENVIAVRVYDSEMLGGMVQGEIEICHPINLLRLDLDLAGTWRLQMSDSRAYARPDYDDTAWQQVAVPAFWDSYGYKDYDGIGWYRTRFHVSEQLSQERLILMLGKIDDLDEVYLNGKLLGRTGTWPGDKNYRGLYGNYYQQERAYFIPPDMLHHGQENFLAVRVFDTFRHGGIYDGPIGLVTRKHYLSWREKRSLLKEMYHQLFKR